MRRLRLGIVKYLNTLPFTVPLESGKVPLDATLSYGVPSVLNRALLQGELDLALVSSAVYLRNRDTLHLVEGPCIAASGPVQSVCLFSRQPPDSLDKATVGITRNSASSVLLLRVLCENLWHVKPRYETFQEDRDARHFDNFLLIGDSCLEERQNTSLHVTDLSHEWMKLTGTPFVFAVLAARQDATEIAEKLEPVRRALLQSLKWSTGYRQDVVAAGRQRSALPDSLLETYFNCLEHWMDVPHYEGLSQFGTKIGSLCCEEAL